MSQDVSESAAEDVAFVGGHLQRFLDGIGEAVAREAEVLEHGFELSERINVKCVFGIWQFGVDSTQIINMF